MLPGFRGARHSLRLNTSNDLIKKNLKKVREDISTDLERRLFKGSLNIPGPHYRTTIHEYLQSFKYCLLSSVACYRISSNAFVT